MGRDPLVERRHQVGGGREVVVEGPARDAGGADELLDRGGLEAALGDDGLGRAQQQLTRLRAALPGGGGPGLQIDPHGSTRPVVMPGGRRHAMSAACPSIRAATSSDTGPPWVCWMRTSRFSASTISWRAWGEIALIARVVARDRASAVWTSISRAREL